MEAFLQERLENCAKAVKLLKEAKKHSFQKQFSDLIQERRLLVKEKLPEKKTKKVSETLNAICDTNNG